MKGMLVGRIGALLAVAGGAAGLTLAATGGGPAHVTAAGPAAWIDDPLDATVLPKDTGKVTVVAHATDPDGIVTVVLTVDGSKTDTAKASGADLVKVDLSWSPPGPGTYTLAVVGRDPGGAATPPGTARVQVGSDEEQPATTIAGTTTAPGDTTPSTEPALDTTTTSRPAVSATTAGTAPPPIATTTTTTATTTTTPCSPNMPVNTAPANGAAVSATPTLEWAYRGCAPDSFQITVTDPDGAVERDATVGGGERQWTTPTPLPCGTHVFSVRAHVGANVSEWSAATSFSVVARVC